MKLINTLKKYKQKRKLHKLKNFIDIKDSSHLGQYMDIDLRHPISGKKYLEIGENCMIDGHFIFERESGIIKVGDRVHIGGSTLISINSIEIESDVTIAWGCTIYDHNSHSIYWEERKNDTLQECRDLSRYNDPIINKDWSNVKSKPIKICNKVWIGMNVVILKGVTIGEGAVVGAGSVVMRDVQPYTLVVGNPTQKIKELK